MLFDTISLNLLRNTAQWQEHGDLHLHEGFFMLRNFRFRNRAFLMPSQPYLLQGGRVVYVRQGSADYSFNLVDYHFEAGDLVVFYAETLIEKRRLSPDFQLDAFTFASSEPSSANFICVHPDKDSQSVIDSHFSLLWALLQQNQLSTECITLQISSFLKFVAQIESRQEHTRPTNRRANIMQRFISLVSRHAAKERNITYYANKLCIAPHYLSTLIKQTSGSTPMQWINKAAIKEIKVWLAYSDETTAQIADRLNFPCPSSLTKFFKRETGMTPSEYRHNPNLPPSMQYL